MKDFDWTQFTKKIAIKAPMQVLYDAWTIPSEIEKWFLSTANFFDLNGNALPQTQHVSVGNTYKWYWFGYDGLEENDILKANGKDHIQFHFAGDCLVDVQLATQDEYTIVTISQTEIPTDDASKKNIRLDCANGWTFYLFNLKSYYENGIDLRNKDPKVKGVVNS